MQSSSSGLPASRSWSIDVLWSPTAMPASSRRSSETGSSSPSPAATAAHSSRIARAGLRRISGSVAELAERRAGQRAHRVEGDVADELEPDLLADSALDRALQPAGRRTPPRSRGSARSARRPARRSRTACPRRGGSRPARRSRSSSRRRSRSPASGGIDARDRRRPGRRSRATVPVERAAGATGSTTRGCRSGRDHGGARAAAARGEPRRELGQAVGLQADEDDVGVGERRRGRRSPRGWASKSPAGAPHARRRAPASPARCSPRAISVTSAPPRGERGARRRRRSPPRRGRRTSPCRPSLRPTATRRRACAGPCRSPCAGSVEDVDRRRAP